MVTSLSMSETLNSSRPRTLTRAYVNGLKDPGDYHEEELRPFFVRVSPKGTKTYYVRNRVPGDSPCVYVKIGRVEQISAQEARDQAKELLLQMSKGVNPNKERAKRRQADEAQEIVGAAEREASEQIGITFGDVLVKYIKVRSSSGKRPMKSSTADGYELLAKLYLSDWLSVPIQSINSDMVDERFLAITSKSQANKVFRVARALFNFASDEGLADIQQNPCKRLKKKWHGVDPRQRVIKDTQLKRWYNSVMALNSSNVRDYLRLCLFLGLRRNEAAGLRWQDVDFEENTIQLVNTKNQRNHTLPMTWIVRQILLDRRELQKQTGDFGTFVFPSEGGTGHLKDPRKQILRVVDECGIQFNSHDLRRTLATVANDLGFDLYKIGRILNHASAGGKAVTKDYIVSTAKTLQEPLDKITSYLCKQMGIREPENKEVSRQ